MPIKISWYNLEKTIILQEFVGNWTIEEYYHFVDEMVAYLQSVSHQVDIIAEGSQIASSPRDMFSAFRYASRKIPNNEGALVFVKPTLLFKSVVSAIERIRTASDAREYYFADTIEQAAEILRQKRT
ncbi:MAG: hypothetical protein MUF87_00910 [Anaerolineae bacterium]|jgi:hypothetical protein|nr:hypothetical protein [Anaerolineae bacterium]